MFHLRLFNGKDFHYSPQGATVPPPKGSFKNDSSAQDSNGPNIRPDFRDPSPPKRPSETRPKISPQYDEAATIYERFLSANFNGAEDVCCKGTWPETDLRSPRISKSDGCRNDTWIFLNTSSTFSLTFIVSFFSPFHDISSLCHPYPWCHPSSAHDTQTPSRKYFTHFNLYQLRF